MPGGETGTSSSSRGINRTCTSTRGTSRFQDVPRQIKNQEAKVIEQFMIFLEQGPHSRQSAPTNLILPQVLFEDMMDQLDATFENGLEHAGLFGYRSMPSIYGIVTVEGDVDKIDYLKGYSEAESLQPPLVVVGVFHTHLFAFGLGEKDVMGWQGGGPSGPDLYNFFTRPANASAVVSYTQKGNRKIYFLLRPRNFKVKSLADKVESLVDITKYSETVIELVGKKGDPDDISEKELSSLATKYGFVLYISIDSRVLKKK